MIKKTLFVVGARVILTAGRFQGQFGTIKQSSPDVREASVCVDFHDSMTRVAFDDLFWFDYPKTKNSK
jgi:transcription antitermination factor NusG